MWLVSCCRQAKYRFQTNSTWREVECKRHANSKVDSGSATLMTPNTPNCALVSVKTKENNKSLQVDKVSYLQRCHTQQAWISILNFYVAGLKCVVNQLKPSLQMRTSSTRS